MDEGNGKFNLMILCWGEGHSSQIHDHSNSHCFMKMLKGELREIRYTWPKNHPKALESINRSTDNTIYAQEKYNEDDNNNYEENILDEVSRSIMETNSVHYINGKRNVPHFRIQNDEQFSYFSNLFHRQIRLDCIVWKTLVIRTVLFHCIYTVRLTVHVRYSIRKLVNKQQRPSNFTANMDIVMLYINDIR